MVKCVLLSQGGFHDMKNIHLPIEGVCAGCAQPTHRTEKRRLGYPGQYVDNIVTPVCEKCAAIDSNRQETSGSPSTVTSAGLLIDLAAPSVAIVVARVFHIAWPVAIAIGLVSLLVALVLIEPLFYRVQVAGRISKWKMEHPDWPLSLPVVNLLRGQLLPSGEVARILESNEATGDDTWMVMVCPCAEYAQVFATAYGCSIVPLIVPPPVHQGFILRPDSHYHALKLGIVCLSMLGVWWGPLAHLQLWWKVLISAVAVPLAWFVARFVARFIRASPYYCGA